MKSITFCKHYMICEYDGYFAVYHPHPQRISSPLCRVGSRECAIEEIEKEIVRLTEAPADKEDAEA